MSRSNPNNSGAPNPSTRWFEWNGEKGTIRYYDKDQKQNIDVPLPFTFLLLDQLGSVRGWHDASGSGIFSNLVKDVSKDVLIVKSFKGGTLGEGVYKAIKDRVNAQGGRFNANCYLAFKNGSGLKMGVLQFKGAALGAWMEFSKLHRKALIDKAVTIAGVTEGQKGRVTFYTPQFKLTDVSAETNGAAVALDKELQDWLKGYLRQTTRDQAEAPIHHVTDEEVGGADWHAPNPADSIGYDEPPF